MKIFPASLNTISILGLLPSVGQCQVILKKIFFVIRKQTTFIKETTFHFLK